MSYPQSLDEIPTVQLEQEIARRTRLVEEGLCPYCKADLTKNTCRHADDPRVFHPYGTVKQRPLSGRIQCIYPNA